MQCQHCGKTITTADYSDKYNEFLKYLDKIEKEGKCVTGTRNYLKDFEQNRYKNLLTQIQQYQDKNEQLKKESKDLVSLISFLVRLIKDKDWEAVESFIYTIQPDEYFIDFHEIKKEMKSYEI